MASDNKKKWKSSKERESLRALRTLKSVLSLRRLSGSSARGGDWGGDAAARRAAMRISLESPEWSTEDYDDVELN